MKLSMKLVILAVACALANPVPGTPDLDSEVISRLSVAELDQLASELAVEELIRTKRSGSGDILSTVGKSISSGIGNKISLLGRASAGASSFFAGGSSKGYDEHQDAGYSYGPPAQMSYHTKGFDFWTLKKSILNTLLQAAKAITGGVTILKGQLVKGGGALLSGLGKVVSVKGEAVTNLGRHIVNSASLVPPKKKGHGAGAAHSEGHSSPSAPSGYGSTAPAAHYGAPPSAPSSHYGAPTAPAAQYGAPPSSIAHYEAPSAAAYYGAPIAHNSIYGGGKFAQPYEGRVKPSGLQAGFILLKPVEEVPSSSGGGHSSSYDSHGASTGPPASFVSSALQALKGILKPAPGDPAPVSETTGPSGHHYHQQDQQQLGPIFHPPPPLPSGASNAYADHSSHNQLPPFKPLDSYGQPAPVGHQGGGVSPSKLQTMVDGILESQYQQYGPPGLGASNFDSYLASFPNPDSSHSASSHSLIYEPRKPQLQPLVANKIFDNVDKLYAKLHRSDEGRMLTMTSGSGKDVAETTKVEEEKREKTDSKVDKVEKSEKVEKVEKVAAKSQDRQPKHDIVNVEKSITYELRGNRIVRLTDGLADV